MNADLNIRVSFNQKRKPTICAFLHRHPLIVVPTEDVNFKKRKKMGRMYAIVFPPYNTWELWLSRNVPQTGVKRAFISNYLQLQIMRCWEWEGAFIRKGMRRETIADHKIVDN